MAKKSKELKLDMDAINNQHIIDVDLNSEMKDVYKRQRINTAERFNTYIFLISDRDSKNVCIRITVICN